MKFKSKKDIIKNLEWSVNGINDYPNGYTEGVDDAFDLFKERINCYKKYQYRYTSFKSAFPDVHVSLPVDNNTREFEFMIMWSDWLIDYCFGEIINEDKTT